jgi:hypothetical protein
VTEAMYDLEPVLVESDHRLAFSTALAASAGARSWS